MHPKNNAYGYNYIYYVAIYSMCFYKGTALHILLVHSCRLTSRAVSKMTNQGKAVFLVLLISLRYTFGNPLGILLTNVVSLLTSFP